MRCCARTSMVVTLPVSHELMSSLKLEQAELQPKLLQIGFPQNTNERSVTSDTSHSPIWPPYVTAAVVGFSHHACTAVSSVALLVNAAGHEAAVSTLHPE